ncbi:sugar phosphate isomerase/epimerase [Patescibacteria group bacterium]|nr:sugar phosphate isomerase/epimerase [Patescibacteria group bacterium]MBU1682820.1 sugar phosphate isomerase/epimerase [Patescibacteria group bacterium]MBU1934778.1 sugar phosphate isomerase/epimerase [Patescibacteria group bacterium]
MITLHTDSLSKYGLNRIFEFAKKANYDGIEIYVDKNNYDTQNAEYIKELSDQYKLPVIALNTPINGTAKSVEHVVEMAVYLKCPLVVITPPKLLDFKFRNWLRKEVPLLRKKKNIQIALVNAPGKTILGFLPARALNNITDLKKFGMVTLDTSSTVSKKWDLIRIYEHLKKLIVHVHLSNVRHHKEYSLPNEGILPLESFLKKLKSNKYKGSISIRVKATELKAGDDDKVVEKLKKVKKFVDEYFKS